MFIKKILFLFIIFLTGLSSNQNLEKISLQLLWKHQFEFAGFYVAKEKGYYKELGLDLEIKEYDFGINVVDDVIEGKSTYGLSYPTVIFKKTLGKKVNLLKALYQSSPHILVSLKSSGIETINDFKDKRIMISNDAGETASFLSMIRSKGMTFDNMTVLEHSFDIKDLINGKTDIISSYSSNELHYLDAMGIKYNVFDPKDYGFDFYTDILFTSEDELNNNPQRVDAFINASIKGWEYAFNNIEETINLILSKYNTQNKTKDALLYEAQILKKLAFSGNVKFGDIDKNKIQRILDIYSLMGLTKNQIDLNEFIYDNSNSIRLSPMEMNFLNNTKFNIYINNWMPIANFDKNSKEFSGLSVDIWEKIQEKLPIKSEFKYSESFLNSIEKIKEDKNAVLISLSYTEDRAKYGSFTKPYISYPIGIATKDNQSFILNFNELDGKTIAVGENYSAHKLLQKHYPKIRFVPVENTVEALELLANGQVYGAADILLTLKYYMDKYSYTNLKINGTSEFKFDLQIMVNKNISKLVPILNNAIDNLTNDDKKLIENKWIQKIKFVEKIDYTLIYIILAFFSLITIILVWRHKELSKYKNALEFKTKQLNDYVSASSDFVWEIDSNSVFTEVNGNVKNTFGFTANEMIGRSFFEFMKINDVKITEKKFSRIIKNHSLIESMEIWCITKDHKEILLLINAIPVINDNICVGYRGTAKNITKEKEKDIIILQQSKMAALGDMIGNIAHQWRQPLSIISTIVSGYQVKLKFDVINKDELAEDLNKVLLTTKHLSRTIEDFRSFITSDITAKEFTIQEIISESLNILDASFKDNFIDIIADLDIENEIKIKGPKGEMTQVLMNLLNNSKDALKEKDTNKKLIKIACFENDNEIKITVEDNGGGIKNDILPKIFEPYFTTKHKSQGTGLGLHMSYRIITESFNGKLFAKNSDDGVVFTILLEK